MDIYSLDYLIILLYFKHIIILFLSINNHYLLIIILNYSPLSFLLILPNLFLQKILAFLLENN